MLGAQHFHNFNLRLQNIFRNKNAVGSLPMFVFGDFRQLPPSGDKYIFQLSPSNSLAELAGPKQWEHFVLFDVTEIIREKDDTAVATPDRIMIMFVSFSHKYI